MLIGRLRDQGLRVAGFKPVAAGAVWRDGELRNDDALTLIAASRLDLPYAAVNPYCLEPAIAPHLAAAEAGIEIETAVIDAARAELEAACDFIVAEGAGGWCVPLGPVLDIPGLAQHLGLPVVLVVGLRLGCLNHALLTEQAIRASGTPLLGWVGSQVDPRMQRLNENLATLRERLVAPCLGVVAHPGSRETLTVESPLRFHPLPRGADIDADRRP
jgi:dethiobiotin synthetase